MIRTELLRGCTMYTTLDRRGKPRIDCDWLAQVVGINDQGKKYSDDGKLKNLSASGLFMLINRNVENGSKISVTVHLSDLVIDPDAPKLATKGIVVRTEPHEDGSCGVAVKFQNYRFL
jgi:hypothetical protein